eukprot:PITA_36124
MTEEYESIMKNDVWDVVPRPQDKVVVTSKWLYKIKRGADGSVEKYNSHFVAHGFSQKEGWNLHQMDVKTMFLHGSIKQEVYVEQPEGFEIHDRESHVCRLKKSLYGLKQEPRAWYERIDSYLMKPGFTRSEADPNLYFKVEDDKPLILVLTRSLAEARGYFPISKKYVVKILERFGMVDCKPVATSMELDFKKLSGGAIRPVLQNATEYHQLIRALMFLVNSCPNICFAVNTLSQHMVEPHHTHWIGVKNLLRDLRGIITHGLRYTVGDVRLHGYTNADREGSVVDRKSTSRCHFSLGSASISWIRRKQKSVALNTAEVEYIAASMASCEVIWLRRLFSELFGFALDTIVIPCDK